MKVINYNKLIFRYLKEIDAHCYNELIGIESNILVEEDDVSRISKNGWNHNNFYNFIIDEINSTTVRNLLTIAPICHGLVLNFTEYDDNIKILYNYGVELNLDIYINFAIKEQCETNNLIPLKYYGGLYDIS